MSELDCSYLALCELCVVNNRAGYLVMGLCGPASKTWVKTDEDNCRVRQKGFVAPELSDAGLVVPAQGPLSCLSPEEKNNSNQQQK